MGSEEVARGRKRDIVEYYEKSRWGYRLFWFHNDDLAMHYGFWNQKTNNLHEALLNENRFLADKAHIAEGEYVLDAGCGVGGSAIWLARNRGANVLGISITPGDIAESRKNAERCGVSKKASFEFRDYMDTGFPDETFDVVWAIESFCYASDRKHFLAEAYRILKWGGRIVIADGFDARITPNIESRLMKRFLDGFALQSLASWEGFGKLFQGAGFRDPERIDMTEEAKKSSRTMWRRALLFTLILPFFYLFGNRKIVLGWHTGIAQWKALKKGLWRYGVFYAEKRP